MKRLHLLALLLIGSAGAHAQFPYVSPAAPIEANYLGGANVMITNTSFSGDLRQLGRFDNGMPKVGIAEGLILTTGEARYASYPHDHTSSGQSYILNSENSDQDLNTLNGAGSTYDAAVLEFDFATTGTSVSFEYVFASKEYPEYVGSGFNDVFGFFISGPGISGPYQNSAINVAKVNDDPVSVNTINSLINPSLYVDLPQPGFGEQDPDNRDTWFLPYDGRTIPMQAFLNVQCNTTYHAKLAICNTGDHNFHSAVFIKARTLTSSFNILGPLTISPSPVCAGEPITLSVAGDPTWNYTWNTGQSGVGLRSIEMVSQLDQNNFSVSAQYLTGCSLSSASPAAMLTVHNPDNSPPQCLGVNGTGTYTVTIQVGEQSCFTIPTNDAANERVEIQALSLMSGGSFTGNNAFHESGTFCWTPTMTDIGFHELNIMLNDNNSCGILNETCNITVKVICDFCPVRVYYERRTPSGLPLPALTTAGEQITAGYSVDPAQVDGNVSTGDAAVIFRAPFINLQPGFTAGPGFVAEVDPNTCLDDCDACCANWSGITVDRYPNEAGDLVLNNWFEPDGDGWHDHWQVHDVNHPYCAYGAQAYELTIWAGASAWGNPVYSIYESPEGCCPFRSRSPENQIPFSSIHWDGTINTGFWNCHGCAATTGTTYFYVLHIWGCGGELTFTGNIFASGDVNGMAQEPPTDIVAVNAVKTGLFADRVGDLPMSTLEHVATDLVVYPNPANTILFVDHPLGIQHLRVVDSTGRFVNLWAMTGSSQCSIPVHQLAPGAYAIEVMDLNGAIRTKQFIVQ